MTKSLDELTKQLKLRLVYVTVFKLILVLIGYFILIYFDWHIAVGIFFVHWSINLK